MKLEQFGCTEMSAAEMANTQGGGFLADLLTVTKVGYSLTKGFTTNIPLAGPLVSNLLTRLVDPLVVAI